MRLRRIEQGLGRGLARLKRAAFAEADGDVDKPMTGVAISNRVMRAVDRTI